jgi:hypothetical protein
MKKLTIITSVLLALFFTSCVKNEYYEPTPVNNSGYKYIFDDNFDYDSHNWSFSDPAHDAYVSIAGGTLKYEYLPADDGTNTVAINTGVDVRRNFLIQTRLRSDYEMGIVFGVSNSDYGYSFFIDEQGYYALYKEGSSNTPVKTIIDWKQSSAITSGWNDVEFEQSGNYWIGYANGTKLFEIEAGYLSGSKIGFIAMAGTVGYADYLTVQW